MGIKLYLLALMLLGCACVFAADGGVVTSKELGGKERILTYLSTDKPIYRTGEKVYMRAVILEASSNFPRTSHAHTRFELKDPRGVKVFERGAAAKDSVSAMTWEVPQGQAGGVYTLTATTNNGAKAERKFEIRSYQPPRLQTQIEFIRKGYGPGDMVSAGVNIKRTEGGIPTGAKVTAVARVGGVEVLRKDGLRVDSEGNTGVSFRLPEKLYSSDGTLSFIIEDGGVVETAAKSIPILLQTLRIDFYPEGGELVAGLPARVYVQALQPNGKPADISGQIIIRGTNNTVATIKTTHEGRGVFSFTPQKSHEYELKLDNPSGIEKTFKLPQTKSSGAVIRATKQLYDFDEKISIEVNSSKDSGAKFVRLYKREKLLDSVEVKSGVASVAQLDGGEAEGVLMVTLFDSAGRPLAERLVMRAPKFKVNISITPDRKSYVPGGKVRLNIQTTDENGKAVGAVVGLAVTDESVLEMIDKREQAPTLPVMVYLENEVRELADAQVYFDPKNKNAARDVDLLLGTQGWRRFILLDYQKIKEKYPEAAKRALAEMSRPNIVLFELNRARKAVGAMAPVAVEVEKQKVDAMPPMEDNAQAPRPAAPIVAAKKERQAKVANDMMRRALLAEVDEDAAYSHQDKPGQLVVAIRQYAHKVRANRQPGAREDFTETLFFAAAIRTNARNGKASIEFDLSDSVTTFAVKSDAFGGNGALGADYSRIKSIEPFYIEAKMPLEVTEGDVLEIPVSLINGTDSKLDRVGLIVNAGELATTQAQTMSLAAQQRGRAVVRINANKIGTHPITFTAAADGYSDKVTRSIVVRPKGFTIERAEGGLIGPKQDFRLRLHIPANALPGSIKTKLLVYPSPLANMEEALNALLRQPHGCFEQTSSTTYPLVMAQEYFINHKGIDPKKIKQARTLLEKGYKRLISFESKDKGYEWFGGNPAHEALTAYGLMQFVDMSRLMPVDKKMVEQTRRWLLGRRNGKGGFERNAKALDSFGRAPQLITDAYIVWALLESGEKPENLQREIAAVRKKAKTSTDTYFLALAANIMYLAGEKNEADAICKKLISSVEKNGAVSGAETSITNSRGRSLEVETTALAILAWLKNDAKFAAQVEHSMKWLFESCKSGRFGSTQSTILALKAINAYDKSRSAPKAPGTLQLYINGKKFGAPVAFSKDSKNALELPDFSAALANSENTVELKMSGGSKMPFSFTLEYNTLKPDSSDKCALSLMTKLSHDKIVEGEPLQMDVTINIKDNNAPTPIAIIGIPGGLEPRHDQLKELVKSGRIDSYETLGRNVILYWRALKAGSEVKIPLSLIARVAGEYTAPASRAYLYYTDEYKDWQKGTKIKISPKSQK